MRTKLNLNKLEPHPLGALFPPMESPAYEQLVAGLKANGYDKREPMTLLDGQILDGNNRYTGIKVAKIKPTPDMFTEYKGDDPIGYVIQKNLARRNLNPGQAAMLAAKMVEKMEEAERAEKEKAKGAGSANSQKKPKTKGKKAKGAKVTKAAKAVGVSPRSVAAARKLAKKNPKAAADVTAGKKSLHKASKETETQQSAEDAKTKEFSEATARIDKTLGVGFALKAAETLPSKDIMKLSLLDTAEMQRIKPFIESGWPLKKALGYQSVELTQSHQIKHLIERTISQGGKYMLHLDGWIIAVEKKPEEKA